MSNVGISQPMPTTNNHSNYHNYPTPTNTNPGLTSTDNYQLGEFVVSKYNQYMAEFASIHMIPTEQQNQLLDSFRRFIYGNTQNVVVLNDFSTLFQGNPLKMRKLNFFRIAYEGNQMGVIPELIHKIQYNFHQVYNSIFVLIAI